MSSPFDWLYDEGRGDDLPERRTPPDREWFTMPRMCEDDRCIRPNRWHRGPCTWRPLERYL